MKLTLFGGMANNIYILAKELRAMDCDISFIRDRFDSYPMSQPIWQDLPFKLKYEEMEAGYFNHEDWTRFENQKRWVAPCWLQDPLERPSQEWGKVCGTLPVRVYVSRSCARNELWARTLALVGAGDAAVVCGIPGALIAAGSGVPFMIRPHGGDILLAAGYGKMSGFKSLRQRVGAALHRRALKDAFFTASMVGSQNPMHYGEQPVDAKEAKVVNLGRFVERTRFERFPLPYRARLRPCKAQRRVKMKALLEELNLPMPEQELIGLIPSRIDYFWKGHNIWLEALNRTQPRNVHWLVTGWGSDRVKAKKFVLESSLKESVTFLSSAFSRPLLAEFMRASDLCVDKFRGEGYGTAALESMANGTPVMMWINNRAFEKRDWEPPPVLNASSMEDIVRILDRIQSGGIDLEERGQASAAWVSRNHAPELVLPKLLHRLEAAVAQGRT